MSMDIRATTTAMLTIIRMAKPVGRWGPRWR
jgi:hypothetical protein